MGQRRYGLSKTRQDNPPHLPPHPTTTTPPSQRPPPLHRRASDRLSILVGLHGVVDLFYYDEEDLRVAKVDGPPRLRQVNLWNTVLRVDTDSQDSRGYFMEGREAEAYLQPLVDAILDRRRGRRRPAHFNFALSAFPTHFALSVSSRKVSSWVAIETGVTAASPSGCEKYRKNWPRQRCRRLWWR